MNKLTCLLDFSLLIYQYEVFIFLGMLVLLYSCSQFIKTCLEKDYHVQCYIILGLYYNINTVISLDAHGAVKH